MSDTNPVHLHRQGPPETELPLAPAEFRHRIAQLRGSSGASTMAAAEQLVADYPRESEGWALLASLQSSTILSYACLRVGYHRGLDALRANGWRGSGYVRWRHEGNRGFLRCLAGLAAAAAEIGESDEAERCRLFVLQLEPGGVPEGD
ncbi:MAG: DUF3151 family protein [Actinomycetota bacterium]